MLKIGKVYKLDNLCQLIAIVNVTSATAWNTSIIQIPDGFLPAFPAEFLAANNTMSGVIGLSIGTNGNVTSVTDLKNQNIRFNYTYICK